MNQFREDVKLIFPRWMKIPEKLAFLFQKGWSQRAGVVPYTIENGKYMLLLGKKLFVFTKNNDFHLKDLKDLLMKIVSSQGKILHFFLGEKKRNKKLTDLGGGCSKTETPLICAQRELHEESRETLTFNLKNVTHIVITGLKGPHQVIFLVYYPKIGNEEFSFFESLRNEKLNKKGYEEISMLEWLDYDDIIKYDRKELEPSLNSLLDVLLFNTPLERMDF